MKTEIKTFNKFPSIPFRDFDWSAFSIDYEPGLPIGYGRTEEEAIKDLNEQMELLK